MNLDKTEPVIIEFDGDKLDVYYAYRDQGFMNLTNDQIDELIVLLKVHQMNKFRGRNSAKPDRRQGLRRQRDKTQSKFEELNTCSHCGAVGLFGCCLGRD